MGPSTSDPAVGLSISTALQNDVQQRTNGTIRDLDVSIEDRTVTLTGTTSRYYNKQLATSAVLDVAREFELNNQIDVQPPGSRRNSVR